MPDVITNFINSSQLSLVISGLVFAASVLVFLAFAFLLAPVIETQRRLDRELVALGILADAMRCCYPGSESNRYDRHR